MVHTDYKTKHPITEQMVNTNKQTMIYWKNKEIIKWKNVIKSQE